MLPTTLLTVALAAASAGDADTPAERLDRTGQIVSWTGGSLIGAGLTTTGLGIVALAYYGGVDGPAWSCPSGSDRATQSEAERPRTAPYK